MSLLGCGSENFYHEKQVRELCALHALNNLFQNKDAFSKSELDSICNTLSPENWINPHKSMLNLGNYDVNVIMSALQSRSYEMVWFDKRKLNFIIPSVHAPYLFKRSHRRSHQDPSCLNLDNIMGFILNIPSDYKFGFITIPLRRRHWIALRRLNNLYYNLDSKLDAPKAIGSPEDLLNFIRNELDSQDKELFIVMLSEVEKFQGWLKENSNYNNKICDSQNRDAEEVLVGDINGDKDNCL